jgi:hypothetical protein
MSNRYTPAEAQLLVQRFLARKTFEPMDLVKLPYALAYLAVCHLETIASTLTDLAHMQWTSPSQAPQLVLYACGECGTLTRGSAEPPHAVACAAPTCHGTAHPLPGAKP